MTTGATQTESRGGAAWGREHDGVGGHPDAFDPGRLMAEVERGAQRLEQAAERLYQATMRWEAAEEAYELEAAKYRLQADMTHEEAHSKLPSQDRRQDMALVALQREQPEVYVEYHAAKAEHEALAVRYRALAASVSGRQSLLKVLGGAGG